MPKRVKAHTTREPLFLTDANTPQDSSQSTFDGEVFDRSHSIPRKDKSIMKPCQSREILGNLVRQWDAGLLVRLCIFQHFTYLTPRVKAIDECPILADVHVLTTQSEYLSKPHASCRSREWEPVVLPDRADCFGVEEPLHFCSCQNPSWLRSHNWWLNIGTRVLLD